MSKTRLEFKFELMSGVGYPRVNASIIEGEKSSGWLVSIVDTGSLLTLAPIDICEQLFGFGLDELKKRRESEWELRGIGGTKSKAYRMTCSRLVLKSGNDTMGLEKPRIHFTEADLPSPLLIGQRCFMERLWIVHRNNTKMAKSSLLIGHYSDER